MLGLEEVAISLKPVSGGAEDGAQDFTYAKGALHQLSYFHSPESTLLIPQTVMDAWAVAKTMYLCKLIFAHI